jgi:uncharacterized membrane protein YeaQ/YmgE (transglycosylase-associated protein family)
MWLFLAGLIPSVLAILLLRGHPTGGIFILGLTGSFITGGILYSMNHPTGFLIPLIGATALIGVYGVTTPTPAARPVNREHDDHEHRRAA